MDSAVTANEFAAMAIVPSGATIFVERTCAAQSALDAAKNLLDINSPSRRFRDEVGKMIPAGLSIGIDEGAVDAIRSAENLSKSVFKPFEDLSTPVIGVTAENGTTGAFQQEFGGIIGDTIRANNENLVDAIYNAIVEANGGFTMQIDGREFGRLLRDKGVAMA
jgi:hypothetical protein